MKKPDIKDEWIIEDTDTEYDADFPTTYIDVHDHFRKIYVHGFDGPVYAKAISAVPNLLDIGIRILHKLQSETESVTAQDQWDLEQILKDAGCKE